MSDAAERIRASQESLARIGDGDFTPQDAHHALLIGTAQELVAELARLSEENEQLRREAESYTEMAESALNELRAENERLLHEVDGALAKISDDRIERWSMQRRLDKASETNAQIEKLRAGEAGKE